MTAMQRDKGARGEREFCKEIAAYLGENIRRQLGAARDGGPDVLIGELWAIEVKRGEVLRLNDWWRQSREQAAVANRYPALAYRANGQPWRVIVPLDVLLLGHPHWDDDDRNFTATLYVPGFAAVVRETVEPCQTRNRLIGYFSHASPFIHPNH